MKIKITNNEIVNNLLPALRDLSKVKTNSKVAYNIAKTIKKIVNAIEPYGTARTSLLENSCVQIDGKPKIENGEYIFSSDQIKNNCLKEINELSLLELEIDIFPIKFSEIENIEIAAITLLNLNNFIED